MRSFHDAKAMAKTLREGLAAHSHAITHSQALELVAHQFGLADWNTLAAKIGEKEGAGAAAGPDFQPAIPVIRSFDEAKAREFYCDFLGFAVDWEHRFHPGAPLYIQLSRGDLLIHLSEHHGDASPGTTCFCRMHGIAAFHAELIGKNYRNNRPGLEKQGWGLEVTVNDPFGNRIRFCEQQHG
jgi:catechol 2,3-dioxygenase-like lactoylglutathione lyase family enzyme